MAPVLCDVWQMGGHADNMADAKAIYKYEMHGTVGNMTDVPPGPNMLHLFDFLIYPCPYLPLHRILALCVPPSILWCGQRHRKPKLKLKSYLSLRFWMLKRPHPICATTGTLQCLLIDGSLTLMYMASFMVLARFL